MEYINGLTDITLNMYTTPALTNSNKLRLLLFDTFMDGKKLFKIN